MEIKIETPKGEPLPDAELIHEFKKECLRVKMGLTKEGFEEELDDAKQFFELNKKKILRRD